MITRSARETYRLRRGELIAQMELAMQGDNDAAIRVANHYGIAALLSGPALRWLALAAQRGDPGSSAVLGAYLTIRDGPATTGKR